MIKIPEIGIYSEFWLNRSMSIFRKSGKWFNRLPRKRFHQMYDFINSEKDFVWNMFHYLRPTANGRKCFLKQWCERLLEYWQSSDIVEKLSLEVAIWEHYWFQPFLCFVLITAQTAHCVRFGRAWSMSGEKSTHNHTQNN